MSTLRMSSCRAYPSADSPNDLMISFYLFAPNGLKLEYGCGGTFVDEANWQVRHMTAASLWGHSLPG